MAQAPGCSAHDLGTRPAAQKRAGVIAASTIAGRVKEDHQTMPTPTYTQTWDFSWAEGASTMDEVIEALQQAITQLREMANAGVTLHGPVREGHIVLSARDAETALRFNMTMDEAITRDRTHADDEQATAQWDNEGGRSGGDDEA